MNVRIANITPLEKTVVDEFGVESVITEYEVIFKITNPAGFIRTFTGRTTEEVDTVAFAWENRDVAAVKSFENKKEEEPGKVIGKFFNPGTGQVQDRPVRPEPPTPPVPPEPEETPPGPNNPQGNR